MRYTTNKNMNLPDYTDVIDIEQLNENFETIDAHFTDPDAHAELFLALGNSLKAYMEEAIEAATEGLIHMIMVGSNVYTKLTTSDNVILCTDTGEEIIAVKKI